MLIGRPRLPPIQRFWRRVEKTDTCWNWLGELEHGYGNFCTGDPAKRIVRAHRYSYELAYGAIPDGLFVCHHCDNRQCVRPDHLFAGTAADNAQDAARKGRLPTKLTVADIAAIRTVWAGGGWAGGESVRKIAKRYNVSHNAIHKVVRNSRAD